ncbi:MAG TPA: class I SAM-dependent methyltransferase, partial [Burkholderiales bacterium]|nr:class I SAM-dependent methyltransferase [Burkholderiales bacterium]
AAEIVGIDINFRNVAVCRKKLKRSGDGRIRFVVSGYADAEPEGYFDAVFCMAVLRHGGLIVSRPEKCDSFVRFDDFEKAVSGLARVLKPGGYLAIRGSNFRFSDAAASAGFDVVLNLGKGPRTDTPVYGPDNRILPDTPGDDGVFCKRNQSDFSFQNRADSGAGTSN